MPPKTVRSRHSEMVSKSTRSDFDLAQNSPFFAATNVGLYSRDDNEAVSDNWEPKFDL